MNQIVITRTYQNEFQTIGRLELYDNVEKIFQCKTLELPWKNNERRISRIPSNHYIAQKHISPRFGNSIWIRGVPNRSEILIHVGNFIKDSLGCILVGVDHQDINGDRLKDVTLSRVTIDKLYEMCGDEIYVNIIDDFTT